MSDFDISHKKFKFFSYLPKSADNNLPDLHIVEGWVMIQEMCGAMPGSLKSGAMPGSLISIKNITTMYSMLKY